MKLTSLLPLLSWGTDKNEGVSEKDFRLLNIFKRSVWVSVIVTSLSELALNILFPGSSWSRPVTLLSSTLETISSCASRAILPMSFFSVLQAAKVHKNAKDYSESFSALSLCAL
jgi:hypothetical protein